MIRNLLFLLLISPSLLFAQLTEDFEDADISGWTQSSDGRWEASDISPLNGNYSLHHIYDNASGDNDQISVTLPAMDITSQNTAWRFRIKYTYNPSGGNNWSVFLMSNADANQMHPSGNADGYALGVNYTGSDDTLRLYRITSGNSSVVTSTTLNWDDDLSTSDIIALEVIRANAGEWEVKYNIGGDFDNLQTIGNGTDNTYTTADYFGLYYLYTSSADRKLWLDDIYIGEEIKDTVSPEIDSLYTINSNTLKIEYSEKIDSAIASDILNYAINGGVGSPDSVFIDELNQSSELHLKNKLTDGQQYTITIQNIEDLEGNVIKDTSINFVYEYIKPLSLEVISANELLVQFSRKLDTISAEDILNYNLDNGIGTPILADVVFDDSTKVHLQFGTNFTNKTYYDLTMQHIADQNLDSLQTANILFLYFVTEAYDAVVNEIMADPYPEVNLPNDEYIEILNNTEFDIDLSGWKLIAGTTEKDFPADTLKANAYLTLCHESVADELAIFGEVLGFSSFPSITNAGTTVKIINDEGTVIDSVKFTIDWYQDPDKEDGGWSLEKIDPLNFCSGITNWKASENTDGGTPGFENSVFGPNQDTTPPEVEKLEIVSSQQLRIYFNEPVKNLTAINTENYTVDQGIHNPYSVILQNNNKVIDLLFLNQFPEETGLNLTIENISDWCDNRMETTILSFTYYIEQPFDVVINEIMADPEPVVELPEYEYMEIYNTTDYDIGITGWTIAAGSTEREIPSAIIKAGEYIVLCSQEASVELERYGKTVVVSGFPSLTNSGQTLILKNREREIISSVTYSDRWYQNEYKADGGWSLEQIDPFNPCGEANNWEASKNKNGGTPGQINSIDADNPDTESPELLRASVPDENTVQLFFSESLHPLTAIAKENYRFDHGLNNPDTVDIIIPENKSVLLSFEQPFESNTIYEVEITGDISDCAGNMISGKTTAKFAVPQNPDEFDLVINEILFNPFAGGVDFVEIYNRSDKIFDLNQLRIASYDDEVNDYKNVVKASDEGHLIFPGEYMAITENPEIVMEQYYTQNPDGFAKVSSLPAYNNDKGRAIMMDKSENTIDNFAYTEDMHFALLASNKGVSLERINYDRATTDKTNWHSASEVVGFATPAYENSQFNPQIALEEKVTINPEIFSPDNDGYQDVTNITFNIEESGYVAHIKIFDSRGRLIKYLANNLLLGINQTITWDGLDDKNQKAPMGVYVVFIELFDLDGNVKQYKKSVVVASKL